MDKFTTVVHINILFTIIIQMTFIDVFIVISKDNNILKYDIYFLSVQVRAWRTFNINNLMKKQ